jgi:hypothetical protein
LVKVIHQRKYRGGRRIDDYFAFDVCARWQKDADSKQQQYDAAEPDQYSSCKLHDSSPGFRIAPKSLTAPVA